jgi:hypothetical protein
MWILLQNRAEFAIDNHGILAPVLFLFLFLCGLLAAAGIPLEARSRWNSVRKGTPVRSVSENLAMALLAPDLRQSLPPPEPVQPISGVSGSKEVEHRYVCLPESSGPDPRDAAMPLESL